MNQNSLTIVLPSNSSLSYFPGNTTTNFSTRLPREIELGGRWLVGISEIHIPCTTLHLQRKDTKISGQEQHSEDIYFQHGTYNSIQTLVQEINESLIKFHNNQHCEKLLYDDKGGYATIKTYKKTKLKNNAVLAYFRREFFVFSVLMTVSIFYPSHPRTAKKRFQ